MCQYMTQLEDIHKQILTNIKKIRQQTLKKFLVSLIEPTFINNKIKSRRARHDYKLAIETLSLIDRYITQYIKEHT